MRAFLGEFLFELSVYRGSFLNSRRCFFPRREVKLQYGVCWANRNALAAETAFVIDDERQVIFDCNGFEWTNLLTFGAADTSYITSFPGNSAIVFVYATDINTARFGALLPQLNDVFRAGLHASTTSGTFVLHHFGKHGCGIDVDGVKRARFFAIA